jgi:hypothetical protein
MFYISKENLTMLDRLFDVLLFVALVVFVSNLIMGVI